MDNLKIQNIILNKFYIHLFIVIAFLGVSIGSKIGSLLLFKFSLVSSAIGMLVSVAYLTKLSVGFYNDSEITQWSFLKAGFYILSSAFFLYYAINVLNGNWEI